MVTFTVLMIVVALTFGLSYSFYTVYTSVSCMVGALSVVVPGGSVLFVRGDVSHDSSYCSAQHS